MDTLHFIICGEDGQPGLIDCLLRESRQTREGVKRGQDVVIDEGNGRFSAERRKFIGADMSKSALCMHGTVSAASAADLAILLVDARMGMLAETRRYTRIVSMLGVRHVVVAVHQMDAIGWDEAAFNAIVADFQALVADSGFASVQAIPLSVLTGDNVAVRKAPSLRALQGRGNPADQTSGAVDKLRHYEEQGDEAIQNDSPLDRHTLACPELAEGLAMTPSPSLRGGAADAAIQNGKLLDRHALACPEFTEGLAMSGDWYTGPTLLEHLEMVDVLNAEDSRPFRMPVQYVDRVNPESPGYCGNIASGRVVEGSLVRIVPGGAEARVKSIEAWQGEREIAGDAVSITLDREVDVECGQVFSSVDDPLQISDQFEASVLCLSERHLVPGRPYLIKLHAAQVGVTITDIKFKLDIDQGSHLAANTLELDDIGEVTLYTTHPVAFEPYKQCKPLGAFTLIDRMTGETVGVGMINFALRRASNIHWQAVDVNKAARAALKSQKPACIWFTGLSGSGKSTVANLLEKRLHADGRHTYLLDGDNVRHGLCRDLGFTEADRVENIRRVAEAAKLMVDAGLIVIASFISPFRAEREFARSLFEPDEFYEVFVDASIEECEKRDVKGLYAKARLGKIANFTGIDSAYECPGSPEVRLDTVMQSPDECVERVMFALKKIP